MHTIRVPCLMDKCLEKILLPNKLCWIYISYSFKVNLSWFINCTN